jgi:hypothetical protein
MLSSTCNGLFQRTDLLEFAPTAGEGWAGRFRGVVGALLEEETLDPENHATAESRKA